MVPSYHRVIFDIWKVTSPDQELNTILRHPSILYYINEVFQMGVFLKQVFDSSRDLRLLTHRFPTHILGRVGLFACFILSHTPSHTLCRLCRPHNSLPVCLRVCSPRVLFLRIFSLVFQFARILTSADAYCCTYREDAGNRPYKQGTKLGSQPFPNIESEFTVVWKFDCQQDNVCKRRGIVLLINMLYSL